MSSIPAAKERLVKASAFNNGPISVDRGDVRAILAELSRLEAENATLRSDLEIRTASCRIVQAERDEALEAALDAASAYMKAQYGLGALDHPTDRARVLAALQNKDESR